MKNIEPFMSPGCADHLDDGFHEWNLYEGKTRRKMPLRGLGLVPVCVEYGEALDGPLFF